MIVLSLFDGISVGRLSLERAGISVDKYYASEIDKFAIKVAMKNYPDTIQLGDITKWREWDIDWSKINLLLAGFCCQSWSTAGKQGGDKDPRGALMWVMLDILHHIQKVNPKLYFLFENVKMKKEFLDYVNKAIGVTPILIDSALVSAQTRKRNFWSNIPNITQPEDRHIYLKDIIECGVVDRDKSFCIDASYFKGGNLVQYFEKHRRQLVFDTQPLMYQLPHGANKGGIKAENGKTPCMTTSSWAANNILCENVNPHKQREFCFDEMNRNQIISYVLEHEKRPQPMKNTVMGAALRNQVTKRGVESQLNIRKDNKSNCVVSSYSDKLNLVACVSERGRRLTPDGTTRDDKNGQIVRGYEVVSTEKTNCLTTVAKDNYLVEDLVIRKLTPWECCRLQTLPDNWCDGISNSQKYRCLGNSWTCDVVAHIFKGLKQ
jgi:site-specific DNA-cytosine methylase